MQLWMPASARRRWYAVCALAVALAFSSALRAPFVFDDLAAIRQNASIRQLLPLSVPLNPPRNTAVGGRPVVNVTFALNQVVNSALGVDPAGDNATLGFHLGNVLIHLACGLLLFGVVRRTVPKIPGANELNPDTIAGFTALLWLLHPIQTEAVDYAVQRTEVLVSAFYLATLYASIRAWDATAATRRWWLAAGIALCALGMASKEVMVTAPVIVILYDLAFRTDSWRRLASDRTRRWFYAGLFATTLIVAASIARGARDRSVGFSLGVSWLDYALTQCWAIAHYVQLIAWPAGLNFDYGDQPIAGLLWIPGAVLLTAKIGGTVVAWMKPRLRWLGFAGAWFLLLLVPSSSVIPIRTEIAAERRVYLASAAVVLLVVVGVELLQRRLRLRAVAKRAMFATIAVALAIVTFQRGLIFADQETLYRDVIEKAPGNPRGYLGVGLAQFARDPQNPGDAEVMFRKAIAADTMSFVSWQSLGVLQLTQARWQDAVYTFTRSLRIEPGNLDAIGGMARAYVELHDANNAMRFVDQLGGRNIPALWAVGNLLVRQGRGSEALRYLEVAAASEKPSSLGVALMSLAYAQSDKVPQAERAAQVATAGAGDTADVYNLAARAMIAAKRPAAAREYLVLALALDPNSESLRKALENLDSLQARRHAQ